MVQFIFLTVQNEETEAKLNFAQVQLKLKPHFL